MNLKFWKKEEEFSDPLGKPDALGLTDPLSTPKSDGFGSGGMMDHSPFPAQQYERPFGQPSLTQPQQPQQDSMQRELQLINAKLDTVKAQLDSLMYKIGQQQVQGQNEESQRKKQW
ncbi:MAG: hypothetical protein ABIA93_01100 [Candidatus Woesearchaeota archaeon]